MRQSEDTITLHIHYITFCVAISNYYIFSVKFPYYLLVIYLALFISFI